MHKADGMKHDHSWASHRRPVSERPNLNCEFSDIPLRKNRKRLSLTENKQNNQERALEAEMCRKSGKREFRQSVLEDEK